MHHAGHAIVGSNPTNACIHVQICGSNSSAAMLVTKWSAGVAPEVNIRNLLRAGDEAYKRGIHPGFETQARCHQKSKTGV